MSFFVWNIYEKSFTPYFASLAPKHQTHRHQMVRKESRVSKFWQDSKSKTAMRFLRRYLLQNTKLFHFAAIICN